MYSHRHYHTHQHTNHSWPQNAILSLALLLIALNMGLRAVSAMPLVNGHEIPCKLGQLVDLAAHLPTSQGHKSNCILAMNDTWISCNCPAGFIVCKPDPQCVKTASHNAAPNKTSKPSTIIARPPIARARPIKTPKPTRSAKFKSRTSYSLGEELPSVAQSAALTSQSELDALDEDLRRKRESFMRILQARTSTTAPPTTTTTTTTTTTSTPSTTELDYVDATEPDEEDVTFATTTTSSTLPPPTSTTVEELPSTTTDDLLDSNLLATSQESAKEQPSQEANTREMVCFVWFFVILSILLTILLSSLVLCVAQSCWRAMEAADKKLSQSDLRAEKLEKLSQSDLMPEKLDLKGLQIL